MKTHKQVNSRLDELREQRNFQTQRIIKIALDNDFDNDEKETVSAIKSKLDELNIEERVLLWFLNS